MHQALVLSEVVGAIVQGGREEHHPLKSIQALCLLYFHSVASCATARHTQPPFPTHVSMMTIPTLADPVTQTPQPIIDPKLQMPLDIRLIRVPTVLPHTTAHFTPPRYPIPSRLTSPASTCTPPISTQTAYPHTPRRRQQT